MKDLISPYPEIEQLFNSNGCTLHPSLVHGLLCGVLNVKNYETALWEKLAEMEASTVAIKNELEMMYHISTKQLVEFLFQFQILLPEDDENLLVRAEALTLWCQGYLSGLKLVGVPLVDLSEDDVSEAIEDIIEISKMNYEEVVNNEDDETAFAELVEYVRMAVILIFQGLEQEAAEAQAAEKKKQKGKKLH